MSADTEVILVHIWTAAIGLYGFLYGLLRPDAPWWSWIVFGLAIAFVPDRCVRTTAAIYARTHPAQA